MNINTHAKPFALAVFLLSFLTGIAQAGAADNTQPRKPNVLMICIDDLNDWTGFLGGHPQARTPHMDRLAKKGINFTNAHCTAPGCSPSRNALLFGVEPHNSGLYPFYDIVDIEDGVLNDYVPLPLLFRENGYATYGISKVFHNPDNEYRKDELWDDYMMLTGRGSDKLWVKEKGYHPEPFNKRTLGFPTRAPVEQFGDYKTAMRAVKFLEQKQEKPFFLAVGFIKPHAPFIMPEENWDRFEKPIAEPPFKADDLTDIPIAGRANAQIFVEIPVRRDKAWEEIRHAYLATVNFTDDNVGRVLDALDASPYADNTIIVLWSDHGFHLGEKRSFSKFSLWNEATRVPFIIYDPRNVDNNGKECAEPVGLIHVYRTLAEMTGLEAPDYVDGHSLVPWLKDPSKPMEQPAMTTWGRGNYTLRSKDWRYTRYFDGSEELYNENDDPNEWTNLAENPEYAALKKKFAKRLPTEEAPQVSSGRMLYNVADADSPTMHIQKHKGHVRTYKAEGLQPPLD